jgi:hypothetical protein
MGFTQVLCQIRCAHTFLVTFQFFAFEAMRAKDLVIMKSFSGLVPKKTKGFPHKVLAFF